MPWKKTPPELIAAFDKAIPKDPRVTRKPMFGYSALYLNGNMFAGTYQDRIVARLGDPERERALRLAGTRQFEPMPGRPMKEYVELPSSVITRPTELARWIERARDHAATLPSKSRAPKRATARNSAKTKTTRR